MDNTTLYTFLTVYTSIVHDCHMLWHLSQIILIQEASILSEIFLLFYTHKILLKFGASQLMWYGQQFLFRLVVTLHANWKCRGVVTERYTRV